MFGRSLGPAMNERAQSNNNNVSLCLKCISQFNLFAALSTWPGLSTQGFISTYLHITIYIDVSTDLVLEHRVLVGHEVDVDVPGPVADHHHQAQHEEEDEEVGGLG